MVKNKKDDESQASRVSLLRSMTGYSRRVFCEKTKISERSLQFWENGEGKGLTEEAAENLKKGCEKIGIYVTKEWLLHGTGDFPSIEEPMKKLFSGSSIQNVPSSIILNNNKPDSIEYSENIGATTAEFEFFKKHCPSAIEFIVPDDSMFPNFREKDFIAGAAYFGKEIKTMLGEGEACIVMTKDGKKLLRHVKPTSDDGYYSLTSYNLMSNAPDLIVQNIELVVLAPVLWLRRLPKQPS